MPDVDSITLRDREPGYPAVSLVLRAGRLYLEHPDGSTVRVLTDRGGAISDRAREARKRNREERGRA